MSAWELFAVPSAGLGGLVLVGLGPAAFLGRLSADVRAALVLPIGAAVVAVGSVLTLLGAPVRASAITIGALGALAVLMSRRRIAPLVRAASIPCAIALTAFSLAAIPPLWSGSWDAASAGNG